MGPVRVVTDGGADLPAELAGQLGITVVDGTVRFGRDSWSGTPEEFWRRVRAGAPTPATGPPAVEALAKAFGDGGPVCAVHVSGELSTTVAHARDAAVRGRGPVGVVDSRSLSVGTGLVAVTVAQAAGVGLGLDELAGVADGLVERTHVHAVIDDVDYLVGGGRAGLVAAGARRGVRQVIAVRGHAIPLRQARDRRRAIEQLFEHITHNHLGHGIDRWALGHGDAADVDRVVSVGCEVIGKPPAFVVLLGPSVGTHAGPDALVLALVAPV